MDRAAIESTIVSVVRGHMRAAARDDGLLLDSTLNDLGISSMARVEMILEIEAELGVLIPDDMLVEQHFGTPRAIVGTACACLGEVPADIAGHLQ